MASYPSENAQPRTICRWTEGDVFHLTHCILVSSTFQRKGEEGKKARYFIGSWQTKYINIPFFSWRSISSKDRNCISSSAGLCCLQMISFPKDIDIARICEPIFHRLCGLPQGPGLGLTPLIAHFQRGLLCLCGNLLCCFQSQHSFFRICVFLWSKKHQQKNTGRRRQTLKAREEKENGSLMEFWCH